MVRQRSGTMMEPKNRPRFIGTVYERPIIRMVPQWPAETWTFYQKDKQHGLRTIWYENGKKRLSAQFIDDSMEGNSKGWFPQASSNLTTISKIIWNMAFAQNGMNPAPKFQRFALIMACQLKIY